MIGIILGLLALVGLIVAVVASIGKTPDHLRGYYGKMFWTIASIAIVAIVVLVAVGLI